MARPPKQCTVAIDTPSSRAAVTALATMLGMSCHLKSRKTWMPRSLNSLITGGPSRTKSTGPSFAHFRPGSRAASSSASRPLGMSKATISSATDQLMGDALRHTWIRERRGSDGHERCPRGEVLAGVGGIAHAADADHGHADALTHAPSREHSDRQQGGTTETAAAVSEALIEQSRHRVHETHRVCSFVTGDTRHRGNIGKHGRQLHRERPSRRPTASANQLREPAGLGPELEPARGRVGTGGVDLEGGDRFERREPLDHVDVISHGRTRDVHDDPRAPEPLRKPRELMLGDALYTRIGEADGVEHAATKLCNSQRGVALARLWSHCLRNDSAEAIKIEDVVKLAAESGGAGGKKNWILESRSEQFDRSHGRSG